MTYTRNGVFNHVVTEILTSYPDAYCTSRHVAKPASFPACYIHEIDRSRPLDSTQLDFEDNQWESSFEIQIVSNKHNTAATEAYSIMEIARAAFSTLFYREFSETSIDGGDTFTVIGRFRRKIGGGDTMPTTT